MRTFKVDVNETIRRKKELYIKTQYGIECVKNILKQLEEANRLYDLTEEEIRENLSSNGLEIVCIDSEDNIEIENVSIRGL